MRRSYRVDRYRGIIEKVRSAMPHATITTDIIVGFPGESEADFQASYDLCGELRFLAAYSFKYSKRPGTPAAELPNQIADDVVAARYDRLHNRLNEVSLSVNSEVVGSTLEVLVTDHDGRRAQGKSRDFRLVHFEAESIRPGDLAKVRIASAKPHFIFGELESSIPTRGGDAFQSRKEEAERSGVFLGVPQLKSALIK
jgi:tRNA-2-methylthio-N6-dimethylallyladenosine synthase